MKQIERDLERRGRPERSPALESETRIAARNRVRFMRQDFRLSLRGEQATKLSGRGVRPLRFTVRGVMRRVEAR